MEMKEITLEHIQPNTFFSDYVYLDSSFVLLSPDTPFTEKMKQRLKDWNYHMVYTSGEPSSSAPTYKQTEGNNTETGFESVLATDFKDKEEFQEAEEFYQKLVGYVRNVYSNFANGNLPEIESLNETMKKIIDKLKSHRKYLLRFPLLESKETNYLFPHVVKTILLSIIIGEMLKLPPHRLLQLGIAALIHEIGMIRLPQNTYLSSGGLDMTQRKNITAHTIIGYKALKNSEFPLSVITPILEHHERLDGSGYPRGITKEKISLYGKIISVTCAFSAMTALRPYRKPRTGNSVLIEMLKDRGKQFDETITRALVLSLSIYPLGSIIELNDGSRGMVVDTNESDPKTPLVKLLVNATGEHFHEEPIMHTSQEKVFIKRELPYQESQDLLESLEKQKS